jgi:hypothetical protein
VRITGGRRRRRVSHDSGLAQRGEDSRLGVLSMIVTVHLKALSLWHTKSCKKIVCLPSLLGPSSLLIHTQNGDFAGLISWVLASSALSLWHTKSREKIVCLHSLLGLSSFLSHIQRYFLESFLGCLHLLLQCPHQKSNPCIN